MFYAIEQDQFRPNVLNVKVPDVSGIIKFIDTYGIADGEYINFITGKTIWASAKYASHKDSLEVTVKQTYKSDVKRISDTYDIKARYVVGQIDTPFFYWGVRFDLYPLDIKSSVTN